MKAATLTAFFAVLGAVVSGQMSGTEYPTYQSQRFTLPTTTMNPQHTSTFSMTPQTSVSVHHTIVRNKPAYPFPYSETGYQTEASEDTSYYYTYEDSSEEKGKKTTSALPITTTTSPTLKSTPRSFWNSQKAQLDARRKESVQKFIPTYSRTTRTTNKPKVEFKVREKPKFGLANKKKETVTEQDFKTESILQNTQTTTPKSVKYYNKDANLANHKGTEKDDAKKDTKNTDLPLLNQIVGRVGEIPVLNTQIQAPAQAQSSVINSYGTAVPGQTGNVQFIDTTGKLQQQPLHNFNPLPPNNKNPSTLSKPEQFLLNLNKPQQPLLNSNSPIYVNTNNNQPQLRNANPQPTLNSNQIPLLNNDQPSFVSSIQLPLLTGNSKSLLSNLSPLRALIAASPAFNTAGRSAGNLPNTNNPSSTLLQRLGSLGVSLVNGGDTNKNSILTARDGGYGGGDGLTFKLGPVTDPLSILLKLLALIPRPLLDLNGRVFFGIELGKNAGLVSGAPKPAPVVHKPIG